MPKAPEQMRENHRSNHHAFRVSGDWLDSNKPFPAAIYGRWVKMAKGERKNKANSTTNENDDGDGLLIPPDNDHAALYCPAFTNVHQSLHLEVKSRIGGLAKVLQALDGF